MCVMWPVLVQRQPCFHYIKEKASYSKRKSSTQIFFFFFPVCSSSCCSFEHYLIQTRFKFPCHYVVQVTDNSWELHAQLSDAPCPSIVLPFPLRNLKPVVQFATVTAAHLILLCVCVCEGVRGLKGSLFATVTA